MTRLLGDCAPCCVELLAAKQAGVAPHLRPQVQAAAMLLEGTGLCRDHAGRELARPTSPTMTFGPPIPDSADG